MEGAGARGPYQAAPQSISARNEGSELFVVAQKDIAETLRCFDRSVITLRCLDIGELEGSNLQITFATDAGDTFFS